MQHKLGSSLSAVANQTQENQILADFEGMLSGNSAQAAENSGDDGYGGGGWVKRLVPIVLLAGVGAALALVPMGFKSGTITGRSVAHTSGE